MNQPRRWCRRSSRTSRPSPRAGRAGRSCRHPTPRRSIRRRRPGVRRHPRCPARRSSEGPGPGRPGREGSGPCLGPEPFSGYRMGTSIPVAPGRPASRRPRDVRQRTRAGRHGDQPSSRPAAWFRRRPGSNAEGGLPHNGALKEVHSHALWSHRIKSNTCLECLEGGRLGPTQLRRELITT